MERKFRFSFLLLAGILLLGAGLIGLTSVPDVMQYAFLPSSVSPTETALPAETAAEDLSAAAEPAKKKPEVSTTPLLDLYKKAAESMGELFPSLTMHSVKAGETISIHDSDKRQESIYLYAILEVAGVAPHSRRLGEAGEFAAWVPLDLVTDADLLVLSAPAGTGDMFPAFKRYAENAIGTGTAINLAQEKFRALMPLLLVFVIAAIWFMKRWIRWLAGYIRIQPEWVPETLGEYEPWIQRFWQLVGVSAQPVTLKTPELAEVQFWSSLVLWGTFVVLLRAAKQTLMGMFRHR